MPPEEAPHLLISLTPMPYGDDINDPPPVIDAINNAVLTYPKTPKVFLAYQLPTTNRAGLNGKSLNPRNHPAYNLTLKRF